ncbi:hypothetical protein [Bacteroides ihuae]|uniref:hypothetical protein n=1 Tax=Bacteroides ihuae TaxID=1852362 RepID=UPI001114B41B|nr:hypothetical protein [Bacteroides ihuae]
MKKIYLLCFFMIGIFPICISQNVRKEKSATVKFLVNSSEKDKCLLQLDKQLYLVVANDIQLIDKEQISSIQMYMPGMDEFNALVSKAKMTGEKIVCVFKISTKPGTKLPHKFTDK